MDYFLSHLGPILFAAITVSVLAVAWQIFTEKNAEARRQKVRAAVEKSRQDKKDKNN